MTTDGGRTAAPHIVLVTDYDFSTGGIEQFVLQLTGKLQSTYTCTVVSWSDRVLVPTGMTVRPVLHGDARALWSTLGEADAILLVTSFNVRLLARGVLDYLRFAEKPVITVVQTSSHSSPDDDIAPVQIGWLRDIARCSDAIVAVSNDVHAALEDLLKTEDRIPPVIVIENAARLSKSRPARARREVVGFIGRPSPQKGYPLYEQLAGNNTNCGLRFMANTVSLPPPKPFPGITYSYNCDDAELTEFFAGIDVLIAPYLHSDGLPLALQEALNCGVPIIGFDSPGVGELLRRHSQVVLEPSYQALESALIAWHDGRLAIRPPTPGSVQTWDDAASAYKRLITSVIGPAG